MHWHGYLTITNFSPYTNLIQSRLCILYAGVAHAYSWVLDVTQNIEPSLWIWSFSEFLYFFSVAHVVRSSGLVLLKFCFNQDTCHLKVVWRSWWIFERKWNEVNAEILLRGLTGICSELTRRKIKFQALVFLPDFITPFNQRSQKS